MRWESSRDARECFAGGLAALRLPTRAQRPRVAQDVQWSGGNRDALAPRSPQASACSFRRRHSKTAYRSAHRGAPATRFSTRRAPAEAVAVMRADRIDLRDAVRTCLHRGVESSVRRRSATRFVRLSSRDDAQLRVGTTSVRPISDVGHLALISSARFHPDAHVVGLSFRRCVGRMDGTPARGGTPCL